ncbi:flagellar basal-body rod protein FlgF [Bartonella sp. TP]|uniref:flagellar basal-body rod protein FlgF n=1 Tax=Bartonella sp. TP TaxID=3057550 RepID=UPI0025B27944|nr:flagellar basal-body rod protein FlgF [Bartonella sp. TP]MDN5249060.1 flagellar basal-body rod protein FlgF [Alphaproteobacteria bacterium]WJW80277.1 flagellar basal-body rod protein FlgF [Bartonella sp. TP]
MQNSIYVGISGQLSLSRRMDIIAQNMANINTAGFRARGLKFDQLLSKIAVDHGDKPSFISVGKDYDVDRPGELVRTESPLDIAIHGKNAWLSLSTPNGLVYTRDGRMNMTADGQLISVAGYNYLDTGGAPIQLDPHAGDPIIKPNGAIYQGNKPVAAIGLFTFPQGSKLSYGPNSSVVGNRAPLPVEDDNDVKIMQGYVENSNVNGVSEMTNLISVNRAFEQIESMLRAEEQQSSEAIKTLGGVSG